MKSFSTKVLIIGINPYVSLPDDVLNSLFEQAGKTKGPIPVRGKLNGKRFKQTLVKYQGAWRLYLNTPMRKDAGIDVEDVAKIEIEYDPEPRITTMPPKFARALTKSKKAESAFEALPPSRQKEILRYLNFLKNEETLMRNIEKVIRHLEGKKTKGIAALASRKPTRPGSRGK